MAPTTIDRTPWNALIDDDGSNTLGTPWTKNEIKIVELDPIDAALAAVETTRASGDASVTTAFQAADTTLQNAINANTSAITANANANACVLLHANSATTVGNANSQNLDQCSISGLSQFDILEIFWTLQNASATNIAQPIRFTTDSEAIVNVVPQLLGNQYGSGHTILKPGPAGQINICNAQSEALIVGTRVDQFAWVGITAYWTTPWRITFQSVTTPSGVTLYWAWNVYRRKGQIGA